MPSYEANVADRFPNAKTLVLIDAHGKEKSIKVDKSGQVSEKLDPGFYKITDEDKSRTVNIAVKNAPEPKTPEIPAQPLVSAAPGYTTEPNVVTGARSSVDAKRKHDPNPQPFKNQRDAKDDEPLRSATPEGSAHPVSDEELEREENPEKTEKALEGRKLMSSTEDGVKLPVQQGEETELASDTPEGTKPPAKVEGEVPPEGAVLKGAAVVPGEGPRKKK